MRRPGIGRASLSRSMVSRSNDFKMTGSLHEEINKMNQLIEKRQNEIAELELLTDILSSEKKTDIQKKHIISYIKQQTDGLLHQLEKRREFLETNSKKYNLPEFQNDVRESLSEKHVLLQKYNALVAQSKNVERALTIDEHRLKIYEDHRKIRELQDKCVQYLKGEDVFIDKAQVEIDKNNTEIENIRKEIDMQKVKNQRIQQYLNDRENLAARLIQTAWRSFYAQFKQTPDYFILNTQMKSMTQKPIDDAPKPRANSGVKSFGFSLKSKK